MTLADPSRDAAGVADDRPLRLGLLRIAQETNALSPVLTTLEDFERTHFLHGDELLHAASEKGAEAPGFIRHAELTGFLRGARKAAKHKPDFVPLFSAWAVPGGPLAASALDFFRTELARCLAQAGPLDGVLVSLHGAMRGEGGTAPEALLMADLRRILGPDVPVAVTVDLHAHLTSALLDSVTLLCAYQTNPHRDHARTGARAADLLVRSFQGQCRPVMAWRSLPMVLGGGTTIDFLPTMRPVFRQLRRLEGQPGVLSASLCMCHLWSDARDLGWAVLVITDGDAELAKDRADQLADQAWAVRNVLPPVLPDAESALRQARQARWRRRLGTVCMSDASDMVGAGAAGENTRLLSILLTQGQDLAILAPIRDAVAVSQLCELPVGTAIRQRVGGRLDPTNPSLEVAGHVLSHHAQTAFGRCVVLDLGHLKLVVTEGPPLAMKPNFYSDLGLSPWRADICVVKSLFPFRLYFLLQNRLTIYARTQGQTDLDAASRLQLDGPVHPKDVVDDWRPADRRRRKVAPSPTRTVAAAAGGSVTTL